MNLLLVGAAYGMLVLVFQEGVGADLLGFQRSPIIAAWLPLFLFAVLFGLSMDYHVFLLSRISERYDQSGDNADSVAHGLRSTANIITGAAAIMIVVFGGFALGSLVEFQQMGFGLAVAVFLDATVVRMVLVPVRDGVAGRRELVSPLVAGVAARSARRGRRARRSRRGAGGRRRLATRRFALHGEGGPPGRPLRARR